MNFSKSSINGRIFALVVFSLSTLVGCTSENMGRQNVEGTNVSVPVPSKWQVTGSFEVTGDYSYSTLAAISEDANYELYYSITSLGERFSYEDIEVIISKDAGLPDGFCNSENFISKDTFELDGIQYFSSICVLDESKIIEIYFFVLEGYLVSVSHSYIGSRKIFNMSEYLSSIELVDYK